MVVKDEVNLANLPSDIIRQLIELNESSELRLISHLWNALIVHYHREPLERVYFFAGHSEKRDEEYNDDDDMEVDIARNKRTEEEKQEMHMYAIVPARYSERIGLGRWLNVFAQHDNDSIEVRAPPQLFPSAKVDDGAVGAVLAVFSCFGALMTVIAPRLALLPRLPQLDRILPNERSCEKKEEKHKRHARFVSTFSRIESLVLQKLANHHFDALEKMLGAMVVHRLEFRVLVLSTSQKKRVINLCRRQGIQEVILSLYLIGCTRYTEKELRKEFVQFVLDLTCLGVRVDVYEDNYTDKRRYFGWSRKYWNELAIDFNKQGVAMKMTTIYDAGFNKQDYETNVKSHMSFVKIAENKDMLKPVKKSRGFNIR